MAEPELRVRRPPSPPLLRRGFLRTFVPVALAALIGLGTLLGTGTAILPFHALTVLQGKMGSKEDFFNDPEVGRILLRHNIRVHVTSMGSRDVATTGLDSYDFAFPSGQPTADLIQRRTAGDPDVKAHRPVLTSPLVLATYRPYAEALANAGIATPRVQAGYPEPFYYDLKFAEFVKHLRKGTTWQALGIEDFGAANDNPVAAHISSVCTSNGGGSYLGLVAYAALGRPVGTEVEADQVADDIAPLIRAGGLPLKSPIQTYFSSDGPATAPINVLYEHQYLQRQAVSRATTGQLDSERVLLYPDTGLMTEPGFISFNPDGRRLGTLLETDPDLHRRAVEIGFRVVAPGEVPIFVEQLTAQRVPVPVDQNTDTKALLPASIELFERLIIRAGSCPH